MSGPLNNLKVLDFSTLLPGPYATMLMADMGAEVVRVESPTRLDLVRVLPPMVGKVSAAHGYLNRGKKSIAIDLKKPEGIEIVKQLVAEYDIVVEQFRPGVMARLGLGYEQLKEINPNLIYCSITGYGQTGPYKDRAGHDINYLALSGLSSYSGRAESGPVPLGFQVADVAGGSHHAVMGILAAVIQRSATGVGQHIDISMTDAAFSLNAMSGAGFLAGAPVPAPEKEYLNGGGFYDYYETKDGRFLSVGGLEPQFVQKLCLLLECPDRMNQALSQKPEDQAAFKSMLAEKIKSEDMVYWTEFFAKEDVCIEPVLNLDESVKHPQMVERNMVIQVGGEGGIDQIGFPIKFSETPCAVEEPGAILGAHTAAILEGLKYSEEQIESLQKQRVIKRI
ncbi:alpha-methylacyl-CoA racemase [Oleiphilus messinensis]|uniref:Alpha-methylacyl-CoA racemase n=1 Tax=Oleiphilus messinensis TaxID=141451 RepID=A0A1Y0IC05_9GAMM|nr:CaiB/BaiF CoA-transferase family protein [Oleiphilus messinensis]ARU57689.1 alpha-methylacyl-CoA racemase [Oleiphilus messinensis]